jgi:hypothetical protein
LRTIRADRPWWRPYREFIERLDPSRRPSPAELTALLPPGVCNANGQLVCFVPAGRLPGSGYEQRVFETGEVPTREGNRHDLFNALAWCRWPHLKAAMNALHYHHADEEHAGRRGPRRDALTHLDESGAIVVSHNRELLESLAARDWKRAFHDLRPAWKESTRVLLCGHGLLEKLLQPYKSVTAHALLLWQARPGALSLTELDRAIGGDLAAGVLLRRPSDLGPVPLMGIPGWWPDEPQDAGFYADRQVFRVPPAGAGRPPVTSVRAL